MVSAECFQNIRTYNIFLRNSSPGLPQAVRWLRRLNTDFSLKDLWFSLGWIHRILLAAELAMAQIFLRESSVFRAVVIAPLLHTHVTVRHPWQGSTQSYLHSITYGCRFDWHWADHGKEASSSGPQVLRYWKQATITVFLMFLIYHWYQPIDNSLTVSHRL